MTVQSFGCRLNLAEGDAIAAFAGDLTVVNTCAVTAEAVRQGRQAVRRAAAAGARVVATGCAAQLDPAGFAALPGVVRVLGNVEKLDANSYPSRLREGRETREARPGGGAVATDISARGFPTPGPATPSLAPPLKGRGAEVRVADILAARTIAAPRAPVPGRHTRGFVEVQTGCDHRCTFCIIPFARGSSRSLAVATVVDHVRALVDGGTNEVVLTGVDLTSFGPAPLGVLVQRLLRDVPALPRLRLSSLDAVEIDDALVEALGEPRLMPHLHLSLQAGDDLILRRMRRRHRRAQAIDLCARVRQRRPGLALGADFIAGFPTETDDQFAATLALVDECGLTGLHVFPFSPRPGTPAARMPQVPPAIARDRAARLRELGARRRNAALAAQVGRPQRILVEADGVSGHTETFLPARLGAPASRGSIAAVVATGVAGVEPSSSGAAGWLECA